MSVLTKVGSSLLFNQRTITAFESVHAGQVFFSLRMTIGDKKNSWKGWKFAFQQTVT